VLGRRALLANDDIVLSHVIADATSALYRNATGDEVVYVQSGDAVVETLFGPISVGGSLLVSCYHEADHTAQAAALA